VIELARKLRRDRSGVERILWTRLRTFKAAGYHFQRQHPMGSYVVDFACVRTRLVVEIDGPAHDYSVAQDAVRQRVLECLGYRVLRFTADDVLRDLDAVADAIFAVATNQPHPNPPLRGGGPSQSQPMSPTPTLP